MKKRQRAARGGELVQKQDRGSGGSYSGSLHSAPRRSGQQRSRFVVQGLRGHRVRGPVRLSTEEESALAEASEIVKMALERQNLA